jgi:aspartate/glutamate racemase
MDEASGDAREREPRTADPDYAARSNRNHLKHHRSPSFDLSRCTRLRDEDSIDGVILGGTELALLLPSAIIAELPAFNTTALHVDAIVKRLRT